MLDNHPETCTCPDCEVWNVASKANDLGLISEWTMEDQLVGYFPVDNGLVSEGNAHNDGIKGHWAMGSDIFIEFPYPIPEIAPREQ
jgi:hypothetical protein